MKALVAGWFSFEGMGATAGDLMVRDVVCDWLGEAGMAFDIALGAAVSRRRRLERGRTVELRPRRLRLRPVRQRPTRRRVARAVRGQHG